MRVLLTGGRGFLGRRLFESLTKARYDVIAPGRPEFDLMDLSSIVSVMGKFKPSIVVHSAAYYGGIGICENEPANLFYKNMIMIANTRKTTSTRLKMVLIEMGSYER